MIDNRLLLVKSITLLYRESELGGETNNSSELVHTVLESIKLPELAITMNSERDCLMGLKETALYMCGNPAGTVYEKDEILQRLKVNCSNDEKLFEAFSQGIEKDMDEAATKRMVVSIRKYLRDTFRDNEIIQRISKVSNTLKFERSSISNVRAYARKMSSELEPLLVETNQADPAIVGSIDVADVDGLTDIFSDLNEPAGESSILLTGWQDLNETLQGGFRRGETWSLPALQHKYKTGFTLTLFRQLATLNTPKLKDPTKKPLMLRISFEDSLSSNIQFLYQNIIENETGNMPVMETNWATAEERRAYNKKIATFVTEKMQVTGYCIKMMRINPSMWTLRDLQDTIVALEADGYEIHCCIVDYLPMMPTTGCDQGIAGFDLQNMVQRARNFFSAKNILFLTPWQLSSAAKLELRNGRSDFIKYVAEKGFYRGATGIDQEVDGELFLHLNKFNGVTYLEVQRGKHRGPPHIDDSEKYFALPFPPKGSIRDDLGKQRIGVRKIGENPKGSAEEAPFFSFNE